MEEADRRRAVSRGDLVRVSSVPSSGLTECAFDWGGLGTGGVCVDTRGVLVEAED